MGRYLQVSGSFKLIFKDASPKLPPLPYQDRSLPEGAGKMPWTDDQEK